MHLLRLEWFVREYKRTRTIVDLMGKKKSWKRSFFIRSSAVYILSYVICPFKSIGSNIVTLYLCLIMGRRIISPIQFGGKISVFKINQTTRRSGNSAKAQIRFLCSTDRLRTHPRYYIIKCYTPKYKEVLAVIRIKFSLSYQSRKEPKTIKVLLHICIVLFY